MKKEREPKRAMGSSIDTTALLAMATTLEAENIRTCLTAKRYPELRRLPSLHQLHAIETLAALNAGATARCPICQEEILSPEAVFDHVAEHTRPSLLNLTAIEAFLNGDRVPELTLLLRDLPVRSAISILDAILADLATGKLADKDAILNAAQGLLRDPGPGQGGGGSANDQSNPRTFRNFQRVGKSFAVAASRIGAWSEKSQCGRFLHRNTVRNSAAVRDIEDMASDFGLAHVGRGLEFEASLERSLSESGVPVSLWGLPVQRDAAVLRFFAPQEFATRVRTPPTASLTPLSAEWAALHEMYTR